MNRGIVKDWTTKAGFRAVILLIRDSHHCGYVGLPKGHPLHGKEYGEHCDSLKDAMEKAKELPIGSRGIIPLMLWDGETASPDVVFDVHGGITFADGQDSYPADNPDELWWFGFDCAHLGDATKYSTQPDEVFRDEHYVEEHCESLARQIAAIFTGD